MYIELRPECDSCSIHGFYTSRVRVFDYVQRVDPESRSGDLFLVTENGDKMQKVRRRRREVGVDEKKKGSHSWLLV